MGAGALVHLSARLDWQAQIILQRGKLPVHHVLVLDVKQPLAQAPAQTHGKPQVLEEVVGDPSWRIAYQTTLQRQQIQQRHPLRILFLGPQRTDELGELGKIGGNRQVVRGIQKCAHEQVTRIATQKDPLVEPLARGRTIMVVSPRSLDEHLGQRVPTRVGRGQTRVGFEHTRGLTRQRLAQDVKQDRRSALRLSENQHLAHGTAPSRILPKYFNRLHSA